MENYRPLFYFCTTDMPGSLTIAQAAPGKPVTVTLGKPVALSPSRAGLSERAAARAAGGVVTPLD